ncbi:hypothetical protein EHV15_18560 [Paenibacillus oralis]|uniref:Uncharacterized protein n=1 Tax=Paenibacillus oralis TaxID=2490856 RepID=A0A3P3U3I3_9BACL|nr:hypothetical protein [Paenibacillus oralis]RRJ64700.1 hypothetical protein EHV15_18560 [Paenibacillus oralis]
MARVRLAEHPKNSGTLRSYFPEMSMFNTISGIFWPYFPTDGAQSGYSPAIRRNNAINFRYFTQSGAIAEIAPFFSLMFSPELFN